MRSMEEPTLRRRMEERSEAHFPFRPHGILELNSVAMLSGYSSMVQTGYCCALITM